MCELGRFNLASNLPTVSPERQSAFPDPWERVLCSFLRFLWNDSISPSCKSRPISLSSSVILMRLLIVNEQTIAGVGILPQMRYSPTPWYPGMLIFNSPTSLWAEYASVCNFEESTMLTIAPSLARSALWTGARRDLNVEINGEEDFTMLTCFLKSSSNSDRGISSGPKNLCSVFENSPERTRSLVFTPWDSTLDQR